MMLPAGERPSLLSSTSLDEESDFYPVDRREEDKGNIHCGMLDATLNEGERNTEGGKKSCFGFTDLNEIKLAMFIE